ncbi:MAG: hypothetical protein QXO55_05300 [Candidatus Korarchaeum sp.]
MYYILGKRYLVLPLSILILMLSVGGVVSAPPPIHPTITFIPPPWIPLLPIEKELRASADSTLFNAYPNNNYGGESELVVGRKVITTPHLGIARLILTTPLGCETRVGRLPY